MVRLRFFGVFLPEVKAKNAEYVDKAINLLYLCVINFNKHLKKTQQISNYFPLPFPYNPPPTSHT